MHHHPKHKKLLVPGLLSLALLPLLFLYTLSQHPELQRHYTLEICNASEEMLNENGLFPLPSRNYTLMELGENDASNHRSLGILRVLVRKLVAKQDTITGIHLRYDAGAKYEDYIEAIDICRSEGLKTFMPCNNDLWLMYVPITPHITDNSRLIGCGGIKYLPDHSKQLAIEQKSQATAIKASVQLFMPVIIMLLVLTIISLRNITALKSHNRLHRHNITLFS